MDRVGADGEELRNVILCRQNEPLMPSFRNQWGSFLARLDLSHPIKTETSALEAAPPLLPIVCSDF